MYGSGEGLDTERALYEEESNENKAEASNFGRLGPGTFRYYSTYEYNRILVMLVVNTQPTATTRPVLRQ